MKYFCSPPQAFLRSLFLLTAFTWLSTVVKAQNITKVYDVKDPAGALCYNTASYFIPAGGTNLQYAFNTVGVGKYTEYDNNTAKFVYQVKNGNQIWNISIDLSGKTTTAPSGSPKLSDCGKTINTTNWIYYTTITGTATGSGDLAGAVVNITKGSYPAFQVGTGASTNGLNFGASSWLQGTVSKQPTNTNFKLNSGQVDIEVDLVFSCNVKAAIAGKPVVCSGESTTLTASGGTSYSWSPGGQTSASITVSQANTYTVTVKDANGCQDQASITVTTASKPTASIDGPAEVCAGDSYTLTASGGGSYLWSPGGQTTASISANQPGQYSVTVTNAQGCSATAQKTITKKPEPTVQIAGNPAFCPDGSTELTASGGGTYLWKPGNQTTASITVNTTGLYSVEVTGANGCKASKSIFVTKINVADVKITGTPVLCDGQPTTLTASAAASYLWSPGGQTSQSILVTTPGTYSVVVKSGQNCEAEASILVKTSPKPVITISGDSTLCPLQNTTLTASGGGVGASFEWRKEGSATVLSSTNSLAVNQLNAGLYTVKVTNTDGCAAEKSIEVKSSPNPTVSIEGIISYCPGDSTTLNAVSTPAQGVTYQWSFNFSAISGATSSAIRVAQTGTYSVEVTTADCCKATHFLITFANIKPTVFVTGTTDICPGTPTELTAFGAGVEGRYNWSTGETGEKITVTKAGTYTVYGISNVGCRDTATVSVTEKAKPNAGSDMAVCRQPSGNTVVELGSAASRNGILWVALLSNPSIPVLGSTTGTVTFTPTSALGTYQFYIYNSPQLCYDTVSVTFSEKLNAGADVELCEPITTAKLKAAASGQTWSQQGTTPAVAAVNALGEISQLTVNGAYFFILSGNGCADTVKVTRLEKPKAGADIVGNSAICTNVAAAKLAGTPAGGTWSQAGVSPSVATIDNNGNITDMTAVGTYTFIYTIGNCSDTVQIATKDCTPPPVGSLGDYVWKDTNNNGKQDDGPTSGVNGVTVKLWSVKSDGATPDQVIADTVTATGGPSNIAGYYTFVIQQSGKYIVQVDAATFPAGCALSPKKDVTTNGTTDADDHDFSQAGLSQVVTIDVNGSGLAKNNPTIDAALIVPCVKPTTTDAVVCVGTTTVKLKTPGANEEWSAWSGNPNQASIGNATGQVTGLSATGDYLFILTYTAASGGGCSDTAKVTVKPLPTLTVSMAPACSEDNSTFSFSITSNGTLTTVPVAPTTQKVGNVTTFSGFTAGTNVTVTAVLNDCEKKVTVNAPSCNCPPNAPQVVTPSVALCEGEPIPQLVAQVGAGETTDWYSAETGGTLLAANTTSYTPTTPGTFWVEAKRIEEGCKSTTRTKVSVVITKINCIPIAVKKISKSK